MQDWALNLGPHACYVSMPAELYPHPQDLSLEIPMMSSLVQKAMSELQ